MPDLAPPADLATPPRTRIAPAPSGSLHIGNLRTALYNWLHARKHGGRFVLRIEDTDAARATAQNTRAVIQALRWAGLDWDEGPEAGGPHGPYVQSDRANFHAAAVRRLLAAGLAYEDYATSEELDAYRERQRAAGQPPVLKGPLRATPREEERPSIRVRTPGSGRITIDDLVRGQVAFEWATVGDFVVQRADGSATYPLANAADDVAQGITIVCRGEDLLSVTPRQALLHQAIARDGLVDEALAEAGLPAREPDWGPPAEFAHLPLVVGPDRKPLSKRHGAVSVQEFARRGYLPQVLLNYLALLGWSPGDGRERLTVEEMIAAFDLRSVGRTAAAFDLDKLAAFNGERIRELPEEELAQRMIPFLDGTYGEALVCTPPTEEELALIRKLVPLVQERMQRLEEVQAYAPFVFRQEIELDPASADQVLHKPGTAEVLDAAVEVLAGVETWTAGAIEQALRALPECLKMGARKVFQPVRVAVTGSSVSPPLFESLALLPRERVLERIRAAIVLAKEKEPAQ